jgi:hypothetical protein
MTLLCQACELRPPSIEERNDDPREPYFVCNECHKRLITYSLRPLEWYNLAKRHGWSKFLLHDDFYDSDGTATQPKAKVKDAASYPVPSLSQVEATPGALLDFSMTRWRIEDDLRAAWLRLSAESVISCLTERFDRTQNATVRTVTLEVAGKFRDKASDFVRHAWSAYPDIGSFWNLAAVTAACLPEAEGFPLVRGALDAMMENSRRQELIALVHFRSTRSLDWIEENATTPIVDAWGYLAASSRLSWPRCEQWLKAGRPLNLIAVDALLDITNPRTQFLKEICPTLENRPSENELRESIEALLASDTSPRVQQRASAVLDRLQALCRSA